MFKTVRRVLLSLHLIARSNTYSNERKNCIICGIALSSSISSTFVEGIHPYSKRCFRADKSRIETLGQKLLFDSQKGDCGTDSFARIHWMIPSLLSICGSKNGFHTSHQYIAHCVYLQLL